MSTHILVLTGLAIMAATAFFAALLIRGASRLEREIRAEQEASEAPCGPEGSGE